MKLEFGSNDNECEGDSSHGCEYCGKPLEPLGTIEFGEHFSITTYGECDCEGYLEFLRAKQRMEEAEAKRKLAERQLSSGISRKFLQAEISQRASARYLEGFADLNGEGLYIYGDVGTGKTYEASALAKAFIGAGYGVCLTTTIDMLDSIRGSYNDPFSKGIGYFSHIDILILDDLGKENANSWAMTTMFQVLDKRYGDLRPTIFTSQYPMSKLEERLSRSGERESARAIVSRIHETSEPLFLSRGDRRRERRQGQS